MSSDFDLINPYWVKMSDLEDVLDLSYLAEGHPMLATYHLIYRSMERVDLAIFYIERWDLAQFRFQSGRLNYRKMARELNELISHRNAVRRKAGQDEVHEVGLRAMELTIKSLFSQK
jgi:hypothetical protein